MSRARSDRVPVEKVAVPVDRIKRRKAIAVGLRARLPLVTRWIALSLIVAGIVFVGISYYKLRNNKPLVLHNEPTKLSTEVMSEIIGYERRVTDGGRLRLLVKAAKDITFADQHHELEDVVVE